MTKGVHNKRREHSVSTADKKYSATVEANNIITKSYCQRCLKYGFYHKLGHRL